MTRTNPSAAIFFGSLVFVSLGLTGSLKTQPAREELERFEVASIKPAKANDGRPSVEFRPGGFRAANVTLQMLIQVAYDIRKEQISGGAGWTDAEQYTVAAKSPEGNALSPEEQPALTRKRLQTLLAERFSLVLKRETNPAAGYVLTVDRRGHKMAAATDTDTRQMRQAGRWELNVVGTEMAMFARFLGVHLRATVDDETGLTGKFNFHLNWSPTTWTPGEPILSPFAEQPEESLVPAVREQLGLRLERRKVATDRYTIERAERPSGN